MTFLIADTFTESLGRLTGDEQKAVKTTAFDLQLNPASPGMSFHKLDKAKDKNFWSVRVSRDLRMIVHKTADSLLLCYADHHDAAYTWAERRKLQTHPKTGAAQLVEIRETVQEVVVPTFVEGPARTMAGALFRQYSDDELLSYGVPLEWLPDVRKATEDSLFALAEHLPAEAAEALLELATGGKPRLPQLVPAASDPFAHPDAKRRFRIMADVEELTRALDYPWEKWTVFLHPDQRSLVEASFSGPARVAGSAGTGKTIVALHRAAHLVRSNPDSRVLLTTLSDPLAKALEARLFLLLRSEPRLAERIDVISMAGIAKRLHRIHLGAVTIASEAVVFSMLREASEKISDHKFGQSFLLAEWLQVVDAWQLDGWEAYRDVARLGRKTRLPEKQRTVLWEIFELVRARLAAENLTTEAAMFTRLASYYGDNGKSPFDFVVVDEAQDLSVPQMRFVAALAGKRSDGLFFAGDLGQRIFQQPFSWKSLGVDIRGRSRTLRVNYRTSHQIRTQSDRLLGPSMTDVDGNNEERNDTISVFNGPDPLIRRSKSQADEIAVVAEWLTERTQAGVRPNEFGVFVRSPAQYDRARKAVERAGLRFHVRDDGVGSDEVFVSISTMHLAKGLEFRAVVVMACDDEIIPLQERIEAVGDDADLQEVYDTERQLLYVACTRARDALLVTCTEPGSEFLDDLGGVP